MQESCVKVYDVGRKRDHDDDAEEDEEEELAGGSENDDGSDSGSEADDDWSLTTRPTRPVIHGHSTFPHSMHLVSKSSIRSNAQEGNSDDSDGVADLDIEDIIEFDLD
ncbi:unnamed protein product [Chrysodeixis includens]|uniref:Uncharacterized protein n=1 Tax=Chrysodeixis includens TaxID=689277 RepID=A0A9N8L533_CHRIL|nr:unnamed protein product [Chrysodeixis includens]